MAKRCRCKVLVAWCLAKQVLHGRVGRGERSCNLFSPRSISAEEVKPSSVLAVTKSDLVTMALANLQYEIDEDGTKTTYFDFQMLQRQVVHRFISGKPIIKAQVSSVVATLGCPRPAVGLGSVSSVFYVHFWSQQAQPKALGDACCAPLSVPGVWKECRGQKRLLWS